MSQFYDDDNTDNLLKEITQNLSEQVLEELNQDDDSSKDENSYTDNPHMEQNPHEKKKKGGIYKKILIGIGALLAVLLIAVIVLGNSLLNRIKKEKPEDVVIVEDDTIDKTEVVEKVEIEPADERVINVLLIGEEAMKDTNRGRSDSMMIATINQVQKSVKIASIMRDCYVDIPEHGKGKLNSAYNIGGGPLLVQTIEQNFGVGLNGYVRVDFDGFEEIVNMLGGVEIELTADEASYLNRKDYISKPEFRNVKEGVNLLNGNQALGYSRVRYVKGITGERDDFGRTNRQRTVLKAIFDKYKSKGLVDLIAITNNLMDYIVTDLSNADIMSYVAAYVGTGATELETFRIPMDNAYSTADTKSGNVVLVNFEKNNAALEEFIYGVNGEEIEETQESSENTGTETVE